MNPPMNSKLRDILDELINPLVDIRTGLYLPDHKITEAEKAIRQAVGEEMLELVGLDEPLYEPVTKRLVQTGDKAGVDFDADLRGSCIFIQDNGKNMVKAELRQKIKQWQGGEGE